MTPDEVARYFGRDDYLRRCLVIRPTFAPLILGRVDYRGDPAFKGMYDKWP